MGGERTAAPTETMTTIGGRTEETSEHSNEGCVCVRVTEPRGAATRKAGLEGGAGIVCIMQVTAFTGQRGDPGMG